MHNHCWCPECNIDSRLESNKRKLSKGKIKVTDLVTNEIFIFDSLADKKLLKMLSHTLIKKALKTDGITKIHYRCRYKNPCKVERIPKSKKGIGIIRENRFDSKSGGIIQLDINRLGANRIKKYTQSCNT